MATANPTFIESRVTDNSEENNCVKREDQGPSSKSQNTKTNDVSQTQSNSNDIKLGSTNKFESHALLSSSFSAENHFRTAFLKNKIINIIILLVTIAIIISENFYRNALFEYSLTFEKKWQNSSSDFIIKLFIVITKVGGEYLMALPVGIIIIFFSLVKSVFFLLGMIFCLHFHSLMKIWYGSKRPFWVDPELYQGICDGGFGNPSGHSMTTTFIYLALFLLLTEKKIVKKSKTLKIILFMICIVWTILIILSRLILGVHSVNQVIYGSLLGLFLFLIMYQVFRVHQMNVNFYRKLFVKKRFVIPISCILFFLCAFSVLSKFLFNKDFGYKSYEKILNEKCEGLPDYRKFNLDALFGSLIVVGIAGMYYGQMIFWNLIDKFYKVKPQNKNIKPKLFLNEGSETEENTGNGFPNNKISVVSNGSNTNDEEMGNVLLKGGEGDNLDEEEETNDSMIINELVNNWNENRKYVVEPCYNVFKIIGVISLCCLPILSFALLPKDANMLLIYLFKFGVPFFLVLFFIFGFGFYYIIKISCGPREILKRQSVVEDTDS